jgi:hypothetical protein
MRVGIVSCAIVLLAALASAQTASVRIEVRSASGPVPDAEVVVNGATHRADAQGVLAIDVQPRTIEIVVVKEGFAPASVPVQVQRASSSRSSSRLCLH